MLLVLLSTVPQQDRLQAGLPAPWAHLQPHVWRERKPMDAASLGARRLAVLIPWERRHWVFHDTHIQRESHCLHVCALLTQCSLHAVVLPWKCSGLGSDEQLLHWPWFTHQLQCLLLWLLGLRGQLWETLGEELVCWCGCCLAGATVTIWHSSRERDRVRPEHWHCALSGPGFSLRERCRHPSFPTHVWHESGLPRHQEDLLLWRLSKHRQDFKGNVTRAGDPRHRGRGHRLFPRPGAVWTVSAPSGAALGGGGRTQWRGALWTIPGEAKAICCTWAGQLVEELDHRAERGRVRLFFVRWWK